MIPKADENQDQLMAIHSYKQFQNKEDKSGALHQSSTPIALKSKGQGLLMQQNISQFSVSSTRPIHQQHQQVIPPSRINQQLMNSSNHQVSQIRQSSMNSKAKKYQVIASQEGMDIKEISEVTTLPLPFSFQHQKPQLQQQSNLIFVNPSGGQNVYQHYIQNEKKQNPAVRFNSGHVPLKQNNNQSAYNQKGIISSQLRPNTGQHKQELIPQKQHTADASIPQSFGSTYSYVNYGLVNSSRRADNQTEAQHKVLSGGNYHNNKYINALNQHQSQERQSSQMLKFQPQHHPAIRIAGSNSNSTQNIALQVPDNTKPLYQHKNISMTQKPVKQKVLYIHDSVVKRPIIPNMMQENYHLASNGMNIVNSSAPGDSTDVAQGRIVISNKTSAQRRLVTGGQSQQYHQNHVVAPQQYQVHPHQQVHHQPIQKVDPHQSTFTDSYHLSKLQHHQQQKLTHPTFQSKHNSVGQHNTNPAISGANNQVKSYQQRNAIGNIQSTSHLHDSQNALMKPTQISTNSVTIDTNSQEQEIFQKNGREICKNTSNAIPANIHQNVPQQNTSQQNNNQALNHLNLTSFEMQFLKGQGVNVGLLQQQQKQTTSPRIVGLAPQNQAQQQQNAQQNPENNLFYQQAHKKFIIRGKNNSGIYSQKVKEQEMLENQRQKYNYSQHQSQLKTTAGPISHVVQQQQTALNNNQSNNIINHVHGKGTSAVEKIEPQYAEQLFQQQYQQQQLLKEQQVQDNLIKQILVTLNKEQQQYNSAPLGTFVSQNYEEQQNLNNLIGHLQQSQANNNMGLQHLMQLIYGSERYSRQLMVSQQLQHGSQIQQKMVTSSEKKRVIVDLYGKEKQKSKIPFENAYVEDCYKFIVTPGNNSVLIRRAMEKRNWWIEIQPVHSMFNFKWQPVSQGIKFERLSTKQPKPGESYGIGNNLTSFNATMNGTQQSQADQSHSSGPTISDLNSRQVVNHLEHHALITEKFNLLMVMQKWCDLQKENVFDILPVTFYIDLPNIQKEQAYNAAMQPFISYYQCLEDNKQVISDLKEELAKLKEQELERGMLDDGGNQDGGFGFTGENNQSDDHLNREEDFNQNGQNQNNEDQENADDDDMLHTQRKQSPVDDPKKVAKSLLSNQNGFSTLYKTSGQGGMNQKATKFKSFNFEKRTHTKLSCPLSHFDGFNLWLLKPTHLNRGRGIHVFRDLPTLHKLIKEYCVGKDEESWKKKSKQQNGGEDATNSPDKKDLSPTDIDDDQADTQEKSSPSKQSSKGAFKIKHNTFIIQKYIERPLLICNRKFDIRVWVLYDQDANLYFFKEGYIRTSSSEYGIDTQNIDNAAVHLTNNAVQKNLDSYGKFEDGNMLSFKRFQELLLLEQPDCGIDIYEDIVPSMKEMIIKSIYSVRKTIDPYKRKYCFEMFGYDFILDEDFNTFMIEVNTNPCLEESSQLLKDMLPRMIEDMLKLTVDQIFPKVTKRRKITQSTMSSPQKTHKKFTKLHKSHTKNKSLYKIDEEDRADENTTSQPELVIQDEPQVNRLLSPEEQEEDKAKKAQRRIYPVEGYNDHENMWEKLINVDKCGTCPPSNHKLSNNRNRYTIAVQDRMFKIKKNPVYIKSKKEQKLLDQKRGTQMLDDQQDSKQFDLEQQERELQGS